MTDPIRLQRQLVAATQRADDLERQLAELVGLLTEAAQRLDPGDTDVARVIEQVRFEAQWDASGLLAPAADLLAQAFLDPQETP